MIRALVLICALGNMALGLYSPNLRVKYGVSLLGIGTDAFYEIPKSSALAVDDGWVEQIPPKGPEGLASLKLRCPNGDNSICAFFDDTEYIAGLLIAFDKEKISDIVYDLAVQGLTNWTATINGTTKEYYSTRLYFISSDDLQTDPATRIAARNSSIFLQYGGVWVSAINGELYKISSTADVITGAASIFTKQACVPGMGTHYYYNMTESMECSAETFFPWFPLISDDQLNAVGFNIFAAYTVGDGSRDWFEHSGETIVRYTIPNGPDCLYELAQKGQVTLHIYFIDNPNDVTCEETSWGDWFKSFANLFG